MENPVRGNNELDINEIEAEVVSYIFEKTIEYSENPPEPLAQEVVAEYKSRGEEISNEEAAKKVSAYRIDQFVEEEVKEKWPEQYKTIFEKGRYNRMLLWKKMFGSRQTVSSTSISEPILGREQWENMQAKRAEKE